MLVKDLIAIFVVIFTLRVITFLSIVNAFTPLTTIRITKIFCRRKIQAPGKNE